MKICEKYDELEIAKTPKFHFPVSVKINYKWSRYKFQVTFIENNGQPFTTKWLWNIKWFDKDNQKTIEAKLKRVEDYIDQELKRNIHLSLIESKHEQHIEAKINSLFARY